MSREKKKYIDCPILFGHPGTFQHPLYMKGYWNGTGPAKKGFLTILMFGQILGNVSDQDFLAPLIHCPNVVTFVLASLVYIFKILTLQEDDRIFHISWNYIHWIRNPQSNIKLHSDNTTPTKFFTVVCSLSIQEFLESFRLVIWCWVCNHMRIQNFYQILHLWIRK